MVINMIIFFDFFSDKLLTLIDFLTLIAQKDM
jgi:hypothetical protein